MDTDPEKISAFMENLFKDVEKMDIPNIRDLRNAYAVYKPSYQTELALSEEGRILYGEAFQETPNPHVIDRLNILCLKQIAKMYQSGPLDPRIRYSDAVKLGELLSIKMKLIHIIDIDNETFWKRVVEDYVVNRLAFDKAVRTPNIYWKQLGVELKLAKYMEQLGVMNINNEDFVQLTVKAAPYVERLHITELQPLEEEYVEKHQYNPNYKIYNYPDEDCHHTSLQNLKHLTNLRELSIFFGLKKVDLKYEDRFFQFSYDDVRQLASGIADLNFLESFGILRSKMDALKLKIICETLAKLPKLKNVDFSNCSLKDDCGPSFCYLLQHNCHIESLELKGNHLGPEACKALAYGIQNYKGCLQYLGLARNSILPDGILALGGGINPENTKYVQVKKLDLTGCDLLPEAAFHVVQIVGFHDKLTHYWLGAVTLGEKIGDYLISYLIDNRSIVVLEIRGCGLTEKQEKNIRLLLDRNRFYSENPCMNKEYFTDDDAIIIDEWIKRLKHPLLLRVQQLKAEDNERRKDVCRTFDRTTPSFITPEQCNIQTNTELLQMHFYDAFGCDSDMKLFDPSKIDESIEVQNRHTDFTFDFNKATKKEFLEKMHVGMMPGLNDHIYFK